MGVVSYRVTTRQNSWKISHPALGRSRGAPYLPWLTCSRWEQAIGSWVSRARADHVSRAVGHQASRMVG